MHALNSEPGYFHVWNSGEGTGKTRRHTIMTCLQPNDLDLRQSIFLDLTRTCKQIYEETKGLFYKRNSLILWSPSAVILYYSLHQKRYLDLIQNMWLRIDITRRLDGLPKALACLSQTAKSGMLKTLTINLAGDAVELDDMLNSHLDNEQWSIIYGTTSAHAYVSLFQQFLEIIKRGFAGVEWGNVQRKVHITAESTDRVLIEHKPNTMVYQLHEAFGGELWVADRLCYKNGEELVRPFAWNVYSTVDFVFHREGDISYWGLWGENGIRYCN